MQASGSLRILVLSNIVPFPPRGGLQLRVYHLLRRMAEFHHVTVAAHSWSDEEDEAARQLTQQGIPTITGRLRASPRLAEVRGAIAGVRWGRPPELALYRSAQLVEQLRELFRSQRFDILQIEETILTHYLDLAPPASVLPRVLTLHNIHFEQERRLAAMEPNAAMGLWRLVNALWMRRYEPRAAAAFQACVAVTERDRNLLLSADSHLPLEVIPNGVETSRLSVLPAPEPGPRFLFVGSMAYLPCEDAVLWFAREILPAIRQRLPGATLTVVGRRPSAAVRALSSDSIRVTGEVADVAPYYQQASAVVVPLRAGGGSRLKILEAMALGRAVVSTTIGAEGLHVRNGDDILIADSPEEFAASACRLIEDSGLAARLASAARRLVESRYDWDVIGALQLAIYERLAAASRRTTA